MSDDDVRLSNLGTFALSHGATVHDLPEPFTLPATMSGSFQQRCMAWGRASFNDTTAFDRTERAERFIEEAIELVQAMGLTREAVAAAVKYVYGRPVGQLHQELGGVMVCLGLLSESQGLDMLTEAERELGRCVQMVEKIRVKHRMKPRFSDADEV